MDINGYGAHRPSFEGLISSSQKISAQFMLELTRHKTQSSGYGCFEVYLRDTGRGLVWLSVED